jgi:hypothetical protein
MWRDCLVVRAAPPHSPIFFLPGGIGPRVPLPVRPQAPGAAVSGSARLIPFLPRRGDLHSLHGASVATGGVQDSRVIDC